MPPLCVPASQNAARVLEHPPGVVGAPVKRGVQDQVQVVPVPPRVRGRDPLARLLCSLPCLGEQAISIYNLESQPPMQLLEDSTGAALGRSKEHGLPPPKRHETDFPRPAPRVSVVFLSFLSMRWLASLARP